MTRLKGKTRKIILIVVLVFVVFPLALFVAAFASFRLMDRTNGTIISSSLPRRYLLYVPKSYDRAKPTSLIISIHPAATWPAVEQNISHWNDIADTSGAIIVYPEGTGAFFGGLGPGPQVWPAGPYSLPRDARFVSDLIDHLLRDYNIDPHRIYANGMSNGGGMAFLLSCELPYRIAAVGMVASEYPPWDRCATSNPAPTIMFHGTADKFAPYHGGKSPIAPQPFASVPDWADHLAQRNHCQGHPADTAITSSVRRLAYSDCTDNAGVTLYTIEGAGHTWPGGKHIAEWLAGRTSDDINATRLMWDFFQQHPLTPK
jgi:polyhydroxybutyrate depolymerase